LPRTSEIRAIEATYDMISLKSFIKEGIRKSTDGSKFTHWLPLYFGSDKERALFLLKKSLSMICTGTTKKFDSKQILVVLPKVFLSIILNLAEVNPKNPMKTIDILTLIYRTFIFLLDEFK